MIDYRNKLEILKEYLFLKIDWDCQWPLMSFETYLNYRREDPNIGGWLKILNAQVRNEEKQVKKTMDTFNQTGMLLAASQRRQYAHQLAALSFEEMRQWHSQQRIGNCQNRSLLGSIGSPFSAISALFGLSSPF